MKPLSQSMRIGSTTEMPRNVSDRSNIQTAADCDLPRDRAGLQSQTLKTLFDRFVALEEKLAAINGDKAELFSAAREQGLNTKALRAAFRQALREKTNPEVTAAHDALTASYLDSLRAQTDSVPSGLEFVGENSSHAHARAHTYVRAKDAVHTLHSQEAAVDPRPPTDSQDAPSSIPESAEIEPETALVREEMEIPNCPARTASNEAASLELDLQPEAVFDSPASPEVSSTRASKNAGAASDNPGAVPNTHHKPAQAGSGESETATVASPELDREHGIPGSPAAPEVSSTRASLGMAMREREEVGADPIMHSVPRQSAGDGHSTKFSASMAPDDEPEIPACLYWRNRPSN